MYVNACQNNCIKRWKRQATPELIAQQHLDLYGELS